MPNALILHGQNSTPESHWYPWIKRELEKRGFDVFIPQLPLENNQTPEMWYEVYKKHSPMLDKDSIVIAHSLGVPLALRILERKLRKIRATFLVAGFFEHLDVKRPEDKVANTFVQESFDFETIRKKSEEFFVYSSDNDEEVPTTMTESLAGMLFEDVIIVEDAGHFTSKTGCTQIEDLLIDIISIEEQAD